MRPCSLGAVMVAIVASLSVASADDASQSEAATPDALLQDGAKLTRTCLPPEADWPEDRLSSNFDRCNDAIQTLVKAIQLANDAKTVEAASPSLTKVNVNMAGTALRIGRHYIDAGDRKPALAFLRVACTSFDAVSSFETLTPEQAAAMKIGAAEADRLLEGFRTNCKAIVTPG